ncbi:hypothetical protein WMF45_33730 [Sorangium sp. So ce448]|uniref:hypothetical protein n=1 Tax=Sorangium sp. So ce448 TaxID=3133314 RepID=UPI003F6144EC
MNHYRYDRPGPLAIVSSAWGREFPAVPHGGPPNRFIALPAPKAAAPSPFPASSLPRAVRVCTVPGKNAKPVGKRGNRAAAGSSSGPSDAAAKARLGALAAKVAQLAAMVDKVDERKERDRLLASRPDLIPEVVAVLNKAPIATVRDAVKNWPREPASRLPPKEKQALDVRMGLSKPTQGIRREGNAVVFGVMTREDACNALAAQGPRGRQ